MQAERTIVQIVAIDQTGDTLHRMRWPAEQLADQRECWAVVNIDAQHPARHHLARNADLLVLFQSHDTTLLPIIAERRARDLPTLVEYNDNFYQPPAASPVAADWSKPPLWGVYEQFMQASSGIIVTGAGLEQLFTGKFAKPVHILENHLPQAPPALNLEPRQKGKITLGWAGSIGHLSDLMAVVPVLQSALREYPQLELAFMGNEALPNVLPLPPERCRYHNWGSMAEYFSFLAQLDLGLAPLLDTPYNRCRSDIKAVELAGHSVLPLLTNLTPYQNFLAATGMPAFANYQQLRAQLHQAVSNDHLRREQLRRCYEYVRQERVGSKRQERVALYQGLLSSQPCATLAYQAGFHEIAAPAQPTVNSLQPQTEVFTSDELLAGNDLEGIVQQRQLAGQLTADQAIAAVQRSFKAAPHAALQLARALQRQFPDDPRFVLLQISIQDQAALWQELLAKLSDLSNSARQFYQELVERSAERSLQRAGCVSNFLPKLLTSYPNSAVLLHLAAQSALISGNASQAHSCYQKLLTAAEQYQQNKKVLESLDLSYLRAMTEGVSCWKGGELVAAHASNKGRAKSKEKAAESRKF